MTTPRLNAAFERRIQIAERWFGLREPEDIAHFLLQNSDLRLNDDAEFQQEAMVELAVDIIESTGAKLQEYRKRFGDRLVDTLFAARDRYVAMLDEQ
jgi:hypothetical protein